MFCLVCIITYNGVLVNVFYLSQLIQHNLFLITNQFKILKANNYFTNYIILFLSIHKILSDIFINGLNPIALFLTITEDANGW